LKAALRAAFLSYGEDMKFNSDDRDILIDLLYEDRRLGFIKKRLGEIPVHLDELRREGSKTEARQQERVEQGLELGRTIDRHELEIKSLQAKLEGLLIRQKQVVSVEAMEAGERDITTIRDQMDQLEGRVLEKIEAQEIMQRENHLRLGVDRAAETDLLGEANDLENEILESTQAALSGEVARDKLLQQLSETTRRYYERVFKSHGHYSLASINEDSCGGCGENLPPQQIIDTRKSGNIYPCQGCGRLVLWVKK
jgi:uncharacterized protein